MSKIITHEFETTFECGCIEMDCRIRFQYINQELDIQSIVLTLAHSSGLDKIYVEHAYFPEFEKAYQEDLIICAAEEIEALKREEIDKHEAFMDSYSDAKREQGLLGEVA